jgi:putative Holliday junction resolvase
MTQGASQPVSGNRVPAGSGQAATDAVPAAGRILGFDLGSRRIGVAASDSDQALAVGVDTVVRSGDPAADRRTLLALLDEYEAVGAVVGLPLTLDGRTGPAAAAALEEMGQLAALTGVPVVAHDERLTTVAASSALRQGGRRARQQRGVIDRTAAAVLLQSWLDRRRAARVAGPAAGGGGRG